MYNLPLLSNTSQECQKLGPTQSQPVLTPRSTDRNTSYQIFSRWFKHTLVFFYFTHNVLSTIMFLLPCIKKHMHYKYFAGLNPNAIEHSLCWWADSVASDLYEVHFDCDRKQGLSTADTWMTAEENQVHRQNYVWFIPACMRCDTGDSQSKENHAT